MHFWVSRDKTQESGCISTRTPFVRKRPFAQVCISLIQLFLKGFPLSSNICNGISASKYNFKTLPFVIPSNCIDHSKNKPNKQINPRYAVEPTVQRPCQVFENQPLYFKKLIMRCEKASLILIT